MDFFVSLISVLQKACYTLGMKIVPHPGLKVTVPDNFPVESLRGRSVTILQCRHNVTLDICEVGEKQVTVYVCEHQVAFWHHDESIYWSTWQND